MDLGLGEGVTLFICDFFQNGMVELFHITFLHLIYDVNQYGHAFLRIYNNIF